MASPQIENGYFKVANELAEAFARHQFSGHENRVLWAILRKTFGFNKKADQISFGQLSKETGLTRRRVIEAVNSLVRKNALCSKDNGPRSPRTYWINKDYETWDSAENRTSLSSAENRTRDSAENRTRTKNVNSSDSSACRGNKPKEDKNALVRKNAPTKDKEKTKRKTPSHFFEFSKRFLEYQQQQLGKKLVKITDKKIEDGAEVAEKLVRLDGYDLDADIRPALKWAVQDSFWSSQVRSLAGLRKKSSSNGEMKFANLYASYKADNPTKVVDAVY
jgi:phage replication O-like protein O